MKHTYFATCARGLEPLLAKELLALNAEQVKNGRGGVNFSGDSSLIYRASLQLRTVVRVLRPVLEADVYDPDELYDAVRTVNWANFLTVDQTLAVDCNVKNSNITHSQYASRRVKDAICDQFRDKCGLRPSVDTETPNLGLNLHISQNHMILSLDASWSSLHKRGYRPIQVRAPLNEALACGLLYHLGYNGEEPLHDPLCGSGTFAIEAAWIATNRPPGLTRKWYGFFGWPDFDKGLWSAIREDARRHVKPTLDQPISGADIRNDAIEFAITNARAAGVGNLVTFLKQDVRLARPAANSKPGLLICNPPYGERIGEEEELIELHQTLGNVVRQHWPGWRLAVFTANDFLARHVGIKVARQTHFYNGSIPCKLWEYERTG
jgi:putative N6-adenine-specific DNA methylase